MPGDDVYIKRIGNIVILIPKDAPWSSLEESLDQFTGDFMESRGQPAPDTRENL
jgi:antitoxin VapB